MSLPQPPENTLVWLDPKNPWYNAKVGERAWTVLKAKLTGGEAFGTEYSSFVYLSSADADKLIANLKKDPRGYPQFNQGGGGAKLYENMQKYQEWLVEEYLEKPFRKQRDDKIEDAAIESRMKEIEASRQKSKEEKAKSFISKSTSFRPGKKISAKVSIVSGLMPKRAVPKELLDDISKPTNEPESGGDERIAAPKRVVSSLGRLSFDLIQVSNNLDAVVEVIENDYKNTRTTNKKELEEYKKRVANRGRILGKKDLGDNKVDLMGLVKRYVGGFFSGTGGAIRGLAMFNLLQGLLSGDPSKIIGPLLGIGATYIPAIGMGLGAIIGKSLLGNLFGAGQPNARKVGPPIPGKNVPRGKGFGKFALLAGAGLSLASIFSGSNGEDDQKDRLDDLTEQQKGSVSSDNLVPIPQDDLKRFEALNKKFEKALDFLMGNKSNSVAPSAGAVRPAPDVLPLNDPTIPSGSLLATGAKTSYYDPSLGGINASGAKTADGLPATSSGEGYRPNEFTAAAFPELLAKLPPSMTAAAPGFRGGRTVKSPFNLLVTNPDGKQAIIKINDVGPGVAGHASNHMLDLSVAAKNYLGTGGGNSIAMAPAGSSPGPLSASSLIPTPTPTPVQRTRNIPPPASFSANILPIVIPQKDAPQTVASSKGSNNTVPAFSTSYSENFLVMYSKLTYQIV
jgi:hypothetical protein